MLRYISFHATSETVRLYELRRCERLFLTGREEPSGAEIGPERKPKRTSLFLFQVKNTLLGVDVHTEVAQKVEA